MDNSNKGFKGLIFGVPLYTSSKVERIEPEDLKRLVKLLQSPEGTAAEAIEACKKAGVYNEETKVFTFHPYDYWVELGVVTKEDYKRLSEHQDRVKNIK